MIDTDLNHPYFVTAADEALAISCGQHSAPPTLHLYRREPPGVSVGYFRKVEEDVDITKCNELGIEIVRRSSGGGSIFTDKKQLILGLVTRNRIGKDVEDGYIQLCHCLITALDHIDVSAQFKPPNDIVIDGKKISGSAQVKKKNAYIYHSTIILEHDNNIMEQVLKNHKPGYITSIKNECGFLPEIRKLKTTIINAFQDRFGITFEKAHFSKFENILIKDLIKNKYGTAEWNFKR